MLSTKGQLAACMWRTLPQHNQMTFCPECNAHLFYILSLLQVKGLFWNYISVGIDAKAAYNFHSLREARPWAASGRLVNQAWYAYFSLRTGWFCAAAPIARKLKLKARALDPS